MEYSFSPRARAKENRIAKGRGVCIVGVCPKFLPFSVLAYDTLVSVLISGCSPTKIALYRCNVLSISNICASLPTISRHIPYIVAQLPILLAIFENELALVGKNEPTRLPD
jgi:hypothetical protein